MSTLTPEAIINQVTEALSATVTEVVPWFLEQMPPAYFRDTDEAERLSHLMAIVTSRASGTPLELVVKNRDEMVWTFLRERDRPGLLAEMMLQIPKDAPLQSAKAYSAQDGRMVLDTFRFGERARFDPHNADLAAKRTKVLELAAERGEGDPETLAALGDHFEGCAYDYLRAVRIARIWEHFTLCREIAGTDDTVARLADKSGSGYMRIDVAVGGARPTIVFERVCAHLGLHGYSIRRAYLDVFDSPEGSVAVVGLVLDDDERLEGERRGWPRLERELCRLRWVDGASLRLAYAHPQTLDVVEAETAVALLHLAHARLSPSDPFAYSVERLLAGLGRHPVLARDLARLMSERFDPKWPLDDESFAERVAELRDQIQDASADAPLLRAFGCMLEAVEKTLRVNIHLPSRQGLALRLEPSLMCDDGRPAPYGVFFVHGRGFDAFHVRFRDIARGGIRVVRTRGPEQHAVESRRLFDEAYDLASAQQLKNKDIPEGGAKGVVLSSPGQPVDAALRAFIDGILDLISPKCADRVLDRLGRTERLYLGPDENVSPAMIDWIVARADQRGYPQARVFMSSKPGAGINHKEYGVTSEGVTVFLEEALRYVGIDPRRQRFTVKLTGGPDGDVAGNEIKILFREFGDNACIIGIADGSGSAEDPDGLDRDALLSLVERSAPIAELDPSRLGPRGRVTPIDDPDGPKRRNGLHNRLAADAFVPAGGRPATINDHNWREYLHDGVPSSRVIVEGANLFVTPGAREALSRAGVVIVKDSSANKCGVITSSYEIAAGMLLSEEELLADKARFVAEVLDRLRAVARAEARLLLQEHQRDRDVSLPELSVRLSHAVERANDAIVASFPTIIADHPAMVRRLVRDHLPPSLVELAGRRIDELPEAYRAGIVASSLATRLVYREGLDFVAGTSEATLVDLTLRYLKAEDETVALAAALRASSLADRERLATLIELGGPRAALLLPLDRDG